jgi:hypothetical protein
VNLVACSECDHRFYGVGVGLPERHRCPRCGGGLDLSLHDITSIPLDARWLDPAAARRDPPEVTIVDLRRKRERWRREARKSGRRARRDGSR